MSQTLIIHNDQSVLELLNLNLPIYLGTDVVTKTNFKEAQVLIEHHPGIHLIICAEMVDQEKTANLLIKHNELHKKKSAVIVIGDKDKIPSGPTLAVLPVKAELKQIIQAAAKFLNVTPKKMVEQVVPDFFPININFCTSLKKSPCDIYLKSGDTFKKKYEVNESVKSDEFLKLIQNGTEHIYVNALDRLKFVNSVTTGLLNRLNNQQMTMDEKVSAADEAIQVIQDEAVNGDTPAALSTQELTSAAINTCIEIAQKNPSVAGLLKKLLANKSSFLYKHTQLIIHISQHILSNTEWGSNEQKTKLAFVAFFHDICLTDDKLAHYSSDISVSNDINLSTREKELIIKHANMAAGLIQKFPTAPIGADIIIMQHHGTTSGHGFARTYVNTISPLAIVFIVAEEFAHIILKYSDNLDDLSSKKDEMLEKLNQVFTRSKYQKTIETLKTITF